MHVNAFLIVMLSQVVLLFCHSVPASGADMADMVEQSKSLDERFQRFSTHGSYHIEYKGESSLKEIVGTFEWHNDNGRYHLKVVPTSVQGGEGIQRVFGAMKYQIVCDGEKILVVQFSDNITTGCTSDMYNIGSGKYTASCPTLPFYPDGGARTFSMSKLLSNAGDLGSLKDKSELIHTYEYQPGMFVDIRLTTESTASIGEYTIRGQNEKKYSETRMEYMESVDNVTLPKTVINRIFNSATGELREIRTLTFHGFDFGKKDANSFTIGSVDFCANARIVNRESESQEIARSIEGFKSSEPSIRKTFESNLDESREDLNPGTKVSTRVKRLIVFVVSGVVSLAVFWLGFVKSSKRL